MKPINSRINPIGSSYLACLEILPAINRCVDNVGMGTFDKSIKRRNMKQPGPPILRSWLGPAIDQRNLVIQGPEIIEIPDTEDAARQQVHYSRDPLSHIETVYAE